MLVLILSQRGIGTGSDSLYSVRYITYLLDLSDIFRPVVSSSYTGNPGPYYSHCTTRIIY